MSQLHKFKDVDDEVEQLKRMVREQRAEIFRLKNIIDNLPGSIYWKDRDGVYIGRNAYSHEKMRNTNLEKNTTQNSLIGKTDYDIFAKEVADKYRQHDLEVMESRQELVREELVTLPNGETLVQLSSKRPLRDEIGNIVGIVGNTVDITNLKKIETELRKAKEQLERANIIKTEFIRNMEHDIRTPFNGIWSIASYLWENETDLAKKALLGDVSHCAKELMDYCNDILDFSKAEQGNLPLLEKKFSIRKVIDSVMLIEMPPAKHKKLTLTLDYDDKLPPVLIGDQYRLQRVLINLVSNAIKFTNNGYVKLHAKLAKRLDDKNVIVSFIVKDTGIGIPQEKQDFIYEKFARIIPSNKGIYKGIGLGLRIVKQFMEEMHGEIDLRSELGKGSTFICSLPYKLPLIDDMVEDR